MYSGLRGTGTNSISNREKYDLLRLTLSASEFNVAHINPGSLKSHLSELNSIIANTEISAICVSETWYLPKHNNKLVSLPGINLIRHERVVNQNNPTGKQCGGGVAIYLRDKFNFRILKKSRVNALSEYLFIEVLLDQRLFLGTVYNPPTSKDFDTLEKNLLLYTVKYDHFILCGDFNANLLQTSRKSEDFKNVMRSAHLHSVSHHSSPN